MVEFCRCSKIKLCLNHSALKICVSPQGFRCWLNVIVFVLLISLSHRQLDYKVDDAKLREVFRLAGKVITAEVTKDKDGKSRGFGVVEMDHPVEAVQVMYISIMRICGF